MRRWLAGLEVDGFLSSGKREECLLRWMYLLCEQVWPDYAACGAPPKP
jgi:hypothetical protein